MVYTVTTLPLVCDISPNSHEGAMGCYTQKDELDGAPCFSSTYILYSFWGGGGEGFLFSVIGMFKSSCFCVCPSSRPVLSILGAVLGKFEEFYIQRTVHLDIFLWKKPTICTISQLYFGKHLYMFRTDLLSIIRSLNTVFTAIGICLTSYVDCLLARSGWNSNPTSLADSQHN